MASPAVLDFEKLLAPIAGDNPAGADPRADDSPASDYHAVRDARLANRAAERQLLADAGAAPPDWKPVLQRGAAVLSAKAKDLEIAAFVIEALVRLHGFAGLRDGFRLARELVERFWEQLYPLPDEDGTETRVAPLTGLNGADGEGTLVSPILCVPLTGGDAPYACYHAQQVLALAQVKDEAVRARRVQDGAVPLERLQQAVAETPRDFFAALADDLAQCQEEFARLCAALDEKCGAHAPPTSNIRNALAACRDALEQVAGAKLPTPGEAEAAPEPAANGTAPAPGRTAGPTAAAFSADAIATRDDAFKVLTEVAAYFRRAEPHSVMSYSLEQVVRWGNMPLPDLLRELITDESPRRQLFRHVGIRPAKASSDDD
jgi:type VI secretion system protein ImpA